MALWSCGFPFEMLVRAELNRRLARADAESAFASELWPVGVGESEETDGEEKNKKSHEIE